MAYKAPLPMRIFHYILWALMLFLVGWALVSIILRATASQPPQETPPANSPTITEGSATQVPIQRPATEAVTP